MIEISLSLAKESIHSRPTKIHLSIYLIKKGLAMMTANLLKLFGVPKGI
jgi:hypothetical protein